MDALTNLFDSIFAFMKKIIDALKAIWETVAGKEEDTPVEEEAEG